MNTIRYRATLRPPSLGTLPRGVAIDDYRAGDGGAYNHGSFTTSRPLTTEEMNHFDVYEERSEEICEGMQYLEGQNVCRVVKPRLTVTRWFGGKWAQPQEGDPVRAGCVHDTPNNRIAKNTHHRAPQEG